MSRIFGVLAISLAFGAFLAWPLFAWPVRPGWIGAAVLLLAAVAEQFNSALRVKSGPGKRRSKPGGASFW